MRHEQFDNRGGNGGGDGYRFVIGLISCLIMLFLLGLAFGAGFSVMQ